MARSEGTQLEADALVEVQARDCCPPGFELSGAALAALTVAAQALMGAAASKARFDEERLQQEACFVASLERSEPTARHRECWAILATARATPGDGRFDALLPLSCNTRFRQ